MKHKKGGMLPLLGLLIAAAVLTIWVFGSSARTAEPSDAVRVGVAYLEAQDNKDPNNVIQIRQQHAQAKLDAQREQLLTELTDGTMDPFTIFKDYVLLGDSRAVGYWYWDFLDKDRVIADGGNTIRNLAENIDAIVAKNPSQIFLCYGLNDSSIGYWDTAEEYVTEYMQTVNQIREKLPNATIVVSSILPARDPAFQKSSKWYNIPEWSAALEVACEENNILFANCDKLAEDYPELWDSDGIHFKQAFYPYWAGSLIASILMEGIE